MENSLCIFLPITAWLFTHVQVQQGYSGTLALCLPGQTMPRMDACFSSAQVEPDRWYYHCDRLGMLVWQDMPSMYWEDPFSAGPGFRAPSEKRQFEHELTRLIEVSLPLDVPFTDCKVMLVWQCLPSMYWEDPFSRVPCTS